MKRRELFCWCALVLVGSIFCVRVEAESRKFRIGAILPLSGQVASLGQYARNGITLALDNLPPEERNKIELVYEDDQFNPVQTISAYQKLKRDGKLDAVFVVGSSPANGLGPITEKEKTILVAIGASDPAITRAKPYSFIHWVIPQVLAERLIQEIDRRGLSRVAVVAAEASGAVADADAVANLLRTQGKSERLVYYETFAKELTDFRSMLVKLREKKPDVVVAVLFPGALASFAQQFRDARIGAELAGMETFEDESEIKAAKGALTGAWYVNASSSTQEFSNLYRRRFGELPGWGAANAYDTVRLISAALQENGFDTEHVRTFLSSVKNFPGATGQFSASGDNRFTLPAMVKVVTTDGFAELVPSPGAEKIK